MTSSEVVGMLLRLVVPTREIKVTPKVALSRGSSQQGKARRAAVGYKYIKYNSRLLYELELT